MTVLEPNEPPLEAPRRPLRYWPVVLLACVGLVLSVTAFYGVRDREKERQTHRLEQQSTSVATALIRNLDAYLEVLHSVRAFFDANQEVDRQQFRTFAASALARHEGIQALEWVPRVQAHDRPVFEARARAEGFEGFRLTERDEAGRLVTAAERSEYFPVFYVEPHAGNAQALGHAPRIPVREEALSRARDTGGAVASERFGLIQDDTGGAAVAVFLPVYRGGGIPATLAERRERLLGFVEGVFRVDDIVASAMRGMGPQTLGFHLYDDSAQDSGRFLLAYADGVATRSPDSMNPAAWSASFDFGGRHWSFVFFPPSDIASGGILPWWALAAGVLCTSLGGGYLFSLLSRKADIEREVVERTNAHRRALDEVARRTLELNRAQELDRLKTNFVSAVSHDLRAPLTSILGYAEFLEEEIGGALNPSQSDFVRQIGKSTRRMGHLLDDLLDYARIDAGTFVLRVQPMDLSEQIREIADSLRPQLEEAGLTLEVLVPPDPLLAALDAQRIERVLINLLNNAIKFTPAGGTIRVRAMRESDGLRCEIEDTGIGIAAEDLPRLFQPFSQLESGRHRGGAGLGLSISRTIVEAHGGSIEVHSTPGRGSVFVMRFPQTHQPAAEAVLLR